MLHLPVRLRDEIAALARRGYPHESCGVLVGRNGTSETVVERVFPARNLNRERAADRYELSPEDLLTADAEARSRGLDVVGVWHSHPDHPARPSATDEQAAWDGWSYLIAAVGRSGLTDLRSWRLKAQRFEEEPLVVPGAGEAS